MTTGSGTRLRLAVDALRPGSLVWLRRQGGFGRVVASSQGGLRCRVRPEDGGPAVECLGCELLPVADG